MIKTNLTISEDYSSPPYTEENKEYFKNDFKRVVDWIQEDLQKKCISLNIDIAELEGEIKYTVDDDCKCIYFTAWSKDYVFIRGMYDGHYWVEAIPRNPSNELCRGVGGG